MKKVVFDVDGVLLSEEQYFNASALTVWEILYSRDYMGLPSEQNDFDSSMISEGQIAYIRERVWGKDIILRWLYKHNIESTWDMSHICLLGIFWYMARVYKEKTKGMDTLSFVIESVCDLKKVGQLLMGLPIPTAEKVLELLDAEVSQAMSGKELLTRIKQLMKYDIQGDLSFVEKFSVFYNLQIDAFENWYFGDTYYVKQKRKLPYSEGKTGLLIKENSLVPANEILTLFRVLKESGYQLGIATGRNYLEVEVPFKQLGWKNEIDWAYVATSTDSKNAEEYFDKSSLGKPHSFLFSCAIWGKSIQLQQQYIEESVILSEEDEVWIVGDSDVDFYGSQALGTKFIGVRNIVDEHDGSARVFEKNQIPCVEKVTDILSIIKMPPNYK